MDTSRFDLWARTISHRLSRRGLTGALGIAAAGIPSMAKARKRKKKRKKKKVTFNAFGCVDVGNFCNNAGECCSGVCQGKKGKKKCEAHDTGGCRADQDFCIDEEVPHCTTTIGGEGICFRTTGKASYCAPENGQCVPCNTDADCQPFCGLGAACLACADICEESGGTACFGVVACDFP